MSKTLAPGMRMGWLIPPPELYADVVRAKHASDLGAPALPQLVLATLITSGGLEQHIRQVRTRQRRRRDALLDALAVQLPGARVQGIPAGLHLLVTFPDAAGRLDDTALAAGLRRDGVLVHALSRHRDQAGPRPRPGRPGWSSGTPPTPPISSGRPRAALPGPSATFRADPLPNRHRLGHDGRVNRDEANG